jgi:predicted metal-binding protein
LTADIAADFEPCAGPSGAAGDSGRVTILVCSSCRRPADPETWPRPGAALAENTARAAEGTDVVVRKLACLGNCKRGLSAAMLRAGAWSYVFGDLHPDSSQDLVAGARLFAGSADGFMPFRARPEALKRGLIARIPSVEALENLP